MPQPPTIGGGLMGYPASVDTGQITPFALYLDDPAAGAGAAVTAGAAFLNGYVLTAPATIAQMRCDITVAPTGLIDMGIYDATGTNEGPNTLLGHTGAIAATIGMFTQSLTTPLLLSPGKYWLAFLDTVADTVFTRQVGVAGLVVAVRTTATNLTVLPATLGAVADNVNRLGIYALRSGSFS